MEAKEAKLDEKWSGTGDLRRSPLHNRGFQNRKFRYTKLGSKDRFSQPFVFSISNPLAVPALTGHLVS